MSTVSVACKDCETLEARIRELEHERDEAIYNRDLAIREANRTSDKWKSGITSICGTEIEFSIQDFDRRYVPTLDQFITGLRRDRDNSTAESDAWKRIATDFYNADMALSAHEMKYHYKKRKVKECEECERLTTAYSEACDALRRAKCDGARAALTAALTAAVPEAGGES